MLLETAYDYFYKLKWKDGFVCPDCGFKVAYTISTRNSPLYQCKKCNHQTTLAAGTFLEKTRTSLHKWMKAVLLVCNPESVNAVQLASILQVNYKTAFYMLRKIRIVLTAYDREKPLSGNVHASYCYRKTRMIANPFCRDAKDVPIMIGASFDEHGELSYLKLKPGMRLIAHTEYGIKKYRNMHIDPACRSFVFHIGGRIYTAQPLPMLLSQVITWIGRVFKGVSNKYLEHYLDEFSFRVNKHMDAERIQSDICGGLMRKSDYKVTTKFAA